MENKVINHLCHEHPLILTEIKESVDCYVCGNPVVDLEIAYVCMTQHCSNKTTVHKKCGEFPSQIWHPKHSHYHPLHLFDFHHVKGQGCDFCRRLLEGTFGYRCSDCDFDIDIACEKIGIHALFEEERKQLQHPSHPDHTLTLMRKPATMFYCDGCGEQDVDMAYICSSCEFWVHKTCALMPFTRQHHHHHHHLSLAFSFPEEHSAYRHRCEVCDKLFDLTCWVYFCGDCRYFVHLNCVGTTTKPDDDSKLNKDNNDGSDGVMIEFPLHAHDTSKELITRFVMREKGVGSIPDEKEIARDSLSLYYHEHPLSLVLESFNKDEEDDDEEEEEDDDEEEEEDEEDDDEVKICEACVTPISSPPYYECVSCGYFIHLICSSLPKTLSSSSSPNSIHLLQLLGGCPQTPNKNHNFTLYASSKSSIEKDVIVYECDLCGLCTNGMGYECEDCSMKIDVKCASLPTYITHASHSHHHRKSLILTRHQGGRRKECRGCLGTLHKGDIAYCCSSDDCDFASHLICSLMPMSVRKGEWDKHPLMLLTFDASLDHPSDFFCGFCEGRIYPTLWMYHCRQCDNSFHMGCLETGSGVFRNLKFGRRFEMDGIHPHPLTFDYVTLKKRCDICSQPVYSHTGFECAACYYVVCFLCGRRELGMV